MGTSKNVATHPVAQLANEDMLRLPPLQMTHRSLSTRTHTFHTTYDGDGKRVKKLVPSTGEITIFVYDAAGKEIAEYSTVVQTGSAAKVNYTTNDHLGSPRINTDQSGAVVARHDYHPFGEEVSTPQRTNNPQYVDDRVRNQFTGYERDDETDLDFAQARYYDFQRGRFFSPDLPIVDQSEDYPQSWNLYSYTRNNPLVFVDSLGLWIEAQCSSGPGQCWIREPTDTWETLAEKVHLPANLLAAYFAGTDTSAGVDLSGFNDWVNALNNNFDETGSVFDGNWDINFPQMKPQSSISREARTYYIWSPNVDRAWTRFEMSKIPENAPGWESLPDAARTMGGQFLQKAKSTLKNSASPSRSGEHAKALRDAARMIREFIKQNSNDLIKEFKDELKKVADQYSNKANTIDHLVQGRGGNRR